MAWQAYNGWTSLLLKGYKVMRLDIFDGILKIKGSGYQGAKPKYIDKRLEKLEEVKIFIKILLIKTMFFSWRINISGKDLVMPDLEKVKI